MTAAPPRPVVGAGTFARVVVAVALRPALWRTALDQMTLMARPGWWRSRPYLPLPDPDYLRFRLHTAYGGDHPPDPADVLAWLRWCARMRVLAGPV